MTSKRRRVHAVAHAGFLFAVSLHFNRSNTTGECDAHELSDIMYVRILHCMRCQLRLARSKVRLRLLAKVGLQKMNFRREQGRLELSTARAVGAGDRRRGSKTIELDVDAADCRYATNATSCISTRESSPSSCQYRHCVDAVKTVRTGDIDVDFVSPCDDNTTRRPASREQLWLRPTPRAACGRGLGTVCGLQVAQH